MKVRGRRMTARLRTRIECLRPFVGTLRRHVDPIVSSIDRPLTNAVGEEINRVVRLVKNRRLRISQPGTLRRPFSSSPSATSKSLIRFPANRARSDRRQTPHGLSLINSLINNRFSGAFLTQRNTECSQGEEMREDDGRKLLHPTLEAIRIRAVKRVEAGEPRSDVITAPGLTRPRIDKWLAVCRGNGIKALRARPVPDRPPELAPSMAADLRDDHWQESPAHEAHIRALDTRHDPGEVRGALVRGVGGLDAASVGALGALPSGARGSATLARWTPS